MKETVEVVKGKVRWFYRVKSINGRTLSVSQKYWSKGNAIRAAGDIADFYNCDVKILSDKSQA